MHEPHYLNTNPEIRLMETAARTTLAHVSPGDGLMQMAGEAVARRARAMLESSDVTPPNALILAGAGNNGGDAWVAARALHDAGWTLTIIEPGIKATQEAAAQRAIKTLRAMGIESVKALAKHDDADFDIIIDGLFGIGLTREVSAGYVSLIDTCNALHTNDGIPILAIDVPTGLNANTGAVFRPAIEATETITFIGDKLGLHTGDGCEVTGRLHIETLGAQQAPTHTVLLHRDDVLPLIPHRRANSHKGTWGNVGVIGGANGMLGAATLAARAALHMGPGKVYLGALADAAPAMDLLHPEIMVRPPKTLATDETISAIAVGMGLGTDDEAQRLLLAALQTRAALVIDADALTLLATSTAVQEALAACCARRLRDKEFSAGDRARAQIILTPHPGEAARLLSLSTDAVQSDRVTCARNIAKKYGCIAVLKGAGTVIATPLGECSINSSGNPGMASGGMGDALSGMLAAFMAMGVDAHDAARLGVYLHGAAADAAVHHGMGPHGLTASEVIFEARSLLNSGLDDGHGEHDHDNDNDNDNAQ